jgi:hypothetical protein
MFRKYQHIEKLGRDEVDGILEGMCYVFPKIDGTNASVWLDDGGVLRCGARTREATLTNDNAGFCAHIYKHPGEIPLLLANNPSWTLFGEWLVPHTLKTYRKDAWRHFYVFDVYDRETDEYITYDTYTSVLDLHNVEYIPVSVIVENPTEEWLVKGLESNTFLIEDGKGAGEGLVIKRYDYKNKYGRTTWAKIVRTDFKEKHGKEMGPAKVSLASGLAYELAEEYVTKELVDKTLAKMVVEAPWTSKRIGELLGRVWHDVITEELWGIIKKYKNPTINFRVFNRAVITEIKIVKPELF